jgi:hypothetical protein
LAAALSETGMTDLETNMMRQMISNFSIWMWDLLLLRDCMQQKSERVWTTTISQMKFAQFIHFRIAMNPAGY